MYPALSYISSIPSPQVLFLWHQRTTLDFRTLYRLPSYLLISIGFSRFLHDISHLTCGSYRFGLPCGSIRSDCAHRVFHRPKVQTSLMIELGMWNTVYRLSLKVFLVFLRAFGAIVSRTVPPNYVAAEPTIVAASQTHSRTITCRHIPLGSCKDGVLLIRVIHRKIGRAHV